MWRNTLCESWQHPTCSLLPLLLSLGPEEPEGLQSYELHLCSLASVLLCLQLHGLTFFKAFSADCVRHLAAACTYSRLYAGDRGEPQSADACSSYWNARVTAAAAAHGRSSIPVPASLVMTVTEPTWPPCSGSFTLVRTSRDSPVCSFS